MKKILFALLIALLSVGQVFATSHSTHYGKIVATTMGNGTVYLSTSKDSKTGGTESAVTVGTSVEQSWNCGGAEGSDSKTFYAFATASEGYHFAGWSQSETSNDNTSSDNPYEATHKATGTADGSRSSLSIYAYFEANPAVSVTFVYPDAAMGTLKYTNDGTTKTITEQTVVETNNAFDLTATPQQNYKFLRWWKSTDNGVTKVNLGFDAQLTNISFLENCMVGIEFIPATTPVFIVKGGDGTMYTNLNAACATAKNVSGKTVVLFSDGTLPAGNYTIPQGVTLLIPFDDEYSCYTTEPMILHGWRTEDDKEKAAKVNDFSNDNSFVYRMLTLASGAHLFINGTLSLSAKRHVVIDTGNQGESLPNISGSGRIRGGYGCITMSEGSSIQVGNGTTAGNLYCWGRIRGEGSISVENGSEVREMFVYTDWRDNGKLANYAANTKCFPLNQFYVQDIQVPITFHYGSIETLRAGFFNTSGKPTEATDIPFIGPEGQEYLMTIASNSSITKKYDIPTDRLIFDFDGEVSFYRSKLTKGISVTTQNHIFPITNNWTININSGTTSISYDMNLNAGAIINIHEDATLKLKTGASLYVYDADDWIWEGTQTYGNGFCSGRRIIPLGLPSCEVAAGTYKDANNQPRYIKSTKYSGKTKYDAIRLEADLTDAEIRIDGTLIVEGGKGVIQTSTKSGLFTTNGVTWGSSNTLLSSSREMDGAKIYSTKSGNIIFNQGAGTQSSVDQLNRGTAYTDKAHVTIRSAMLKNAADGDYTPTAGVSGKSVFKYFSADGKWKKVSKVTFKDGDKVIKEDSVAQGDEIILPTEGLPTKAGYELTGWSNISEPMGTTDIVSEAQWEQIVVSVTTIEVTPTEVINDDSETPITENTYIINEQVQAEVVKVNEGATIEITDNASVQTQTLALSTTPAAINLPDEGQGAIGTSSQIKGKGTITAQNVFIDITMDPRGTLDASKYYAFAVPFAVKVDGGVKQFKNNEWVACIHNTDYRAYTYNGTNRAANGKGSNWTLVDNKGTFQPGVFYLVEFAPGMGNIYRFTKAGGGNLNNAANIDLEAFADGTNDADKGWNGIANNALQNASISLSGTGVAQIFDPAQNAFVTVDLGNTLFAIGTPLFVQADGAGIATNSAVAQSTSAPARMLAQPQTETLGHYIVRIAAENANKMADQLFISASEDAENNYVIGKDLVKMFMGNATTAQLWVNNYDKKLSMHQALLINGSAEAPLTLYAPKAGDYKVYLTDIPENATLYLLENGEVIANLNDGAYSVALTKGENTQYGLRINARTIADVVTSINEAKATKCPIQKVLFRNKVYIVRDGKLFNTLGQFVK